MPRSVKEWLSEAIKEREMRQKQCYRDVRVQPFGRDGEQ